MVSSGALSCFLGLQRETGCKGRMYMRCISTMASTGGTLGACSLLVSGPQQFLGRLWGLLRTRRERSLICACALYRVMHGMRQAAVNSRDKQLPSSGIASVGKLGALKGALTAQQRTLPFLSAVMAA